MKMNGMTMSDEADTDRLDDYALISDDLVTDRALTAQDPDRLNHGPIAERVLDLVTVSDPPVNVALFGAWGSGKSSFSALLDRGIKRRGLEMRIINYNAWTFTGESLERNFISHTATALKIDPESKEGRRYHRGLYETKRSSGLELSKIDLLGLLGLTFVILVAIIGVLSMIVFIAATLAKQDPVAAIQATIPSVLASSAVTALLVSGVKQILDGARIESGQGAPTQEQLHETFLALVKDQTAPKNPGGKVRPILFFIDELDRCPQAQVVETLAAIRNYFEAPNCIFVVAADRQVLERAFRALPYPNPGDGENPYYGSASEFFDKIFQYQIPLPPLRGDTLLRLANDLVAEKSTGIWADLRQADEGLPLGQVLYALIPSHVRSPRRVKVLLNAFATNVRIAAARGLPWLPRAREIAKLTAFQTEFPLFANDLLVEPRLPNYLLNPGPAPASRADLLEKHRLEPDPAAAGATTPAATKVAPVALVAGGVTPTDPTPRATPVQADEIVVAQRRLLRQYLVRVSDIVDAGRDLMYLSSAGQAVDLEDPELASLIEEQAVDDPSAVISAAAERPEEVQQRAIMLLARQILQGFGLERANLVTALLGIAEGIDYGLGPAADEATNALATLEKQGELGDVHLVDALGVALGASPTTGEPFIARLFADPRLFGRAERVAAVAAFADRLEEPQREAVWERLGAYLPTDRGVLDTPIRTLPLDVAQEMIDATADAIRLQAGAGATVPTEAPDFVESLFAATDERSDGPELAGDILTELVSETVTPFYATVRSRAPSIIPVMAPPDGEDAALAILVDAPPDDWVLWTSLLPAVEPTEEGPNFGDTALASVFATTAGVESVDLLAVVRAMLPALKRIDCTEVWTALEPALTAALAARPWSSGPQEIQTKIYQAALALRALGAPVSSGVESLVAANIVLGLQTPTTVPHVLALLVPFSPLLPSGVIEVVAPALTAATVPAASEPLRVRSQIGFATAASRAGRADDVNGLLPIRDEVLAALTDPKTQSAWLRVPPPAADVRWMAGQRVSAADPAPVPRVTIGMFAEWAGPNATPDERTDLLLDVLAETDDANAWIEAIAPLGVDEARLVLAVSEWIQAEAKGTRRAELARNLVSLKPNTPKAQALIADLMIWLLERETHADFDTATRLVRAVGTKHRAGPRLSAALQAAVDRGAKLPAGRILELRDSGIFARRKSSWLDKALRKK
jgi:hypothetical protein